MEDVCGCVSSNQSSCLMSKVIFIEKEIGKHILGGSGPQIGTWQGYYQTSLWSGPLSHFLCNSTKGLICTLSSREKDKLRTASARIWLFF